LLAFRRARALIANSDQTRAHLLSLGVEESHVARVYFGTTPSDLEVRQKRKQLIFIGALGWDRNKGLDRLLAALQLLTRSSEFPHSLTVIGEGDAAPWQRMVKQLNLETRVRFAGRVQDVKPELAESEILVSPSRYEAYGLAVQDALTLGVPALVTRTAGIAERYPRDLQHLLVNNTDSAEVWANAIRFALSNLTATTHAVRRFASELCRRSWETMAGEIVSEIEERFSSESHAGRRANQ
jgi:glycosyltransferase involved in cell wall biosynthesis